MNLFRIIKTINNGLITGQNTEKEEVVEFIIIPEL